VRSPGEVKELSMWWFFSEGTLATDSGSEGAMKSDGSIALGDIDLVV